MARLRIFLAGTAIGVCCFAATANAETETWYVLSPATGKCYSGKDLYVFNGADKRPAASDRPVKRGVPSRSWDITRGQSR